ncbi:hypothetical protein LO763_03190 [Glycomyces sp. A-F 0318]|uniref:hypothetical protein n=1 Tax=Glycomyces amatae TaxID=2881355 RepID=UPI001E29F31D|nr:hypothetical protein [Glycomyces amatae]MCD0442628.1 hypothetical protein [Glycomyces amatae]
MITTNKAPIGLLLVTLDRLIDERFEEVLGGHGVSRRQWQLLNLLAEGEAALEELTEALAAFLDGEDALPHLEPLARRGLVRSDAGRCSLTGAGRDRLGALAREVRAVRERTTAGLGAGEYEAVVAGLRKMIGNLEDSR